MRLRAPKRGTEVWAVQIPRTQIDFLHFPAFLLELMKVLATLKSRIFIYLMHMHRYTWSIL